MSSRIKQAHRQLMELFCSGHRQIYRKGEILLRGDIPNDRLFYLESGFIKAYSLNDHGEQYVHLLLGSGDVFPLIALITPSVRDIFYESLSDCAVLMVSLAQVQGLLETNISVTQAVLWQSLRQLTLYSDRLDNMQFKYTQERLAYRLLLLLGRFGDKHARNSTYRINLPLSQQVLASSINASRESVNRELERLARKGVLSYSHHGIIIRDIEALLKLLPSKPNNELWGDITSTRGVLSVKYHD